MSAQQPSWNCGQPLIWNRPSLDGLESEKIEVEFIEFNDFLHARVKTTQGIKSVRWDHLLDPFYKPVELRPFSDVKREATRSIKVTITIEIS